MAGHRNRTYACDMAGHRRHLDSTGARHGSTLAQCDVKEDLAISGADAPGQLRHSAELRVIEDGDRMEKSNTTG